MDKSLEATFILQETNISPSKVAGKRIFLVSWVGYVSSQEGSALNIW